jgi:two-component system sensor histidine kinase YesM
MRESRIRRLLHRLKLEQKIGIVLIIVFGAIVCIGLLEIRHVTSVYDEEMYNISVVNTRSILSELDGILDSVNVFGDYFVGDDIIQTNLSTIKESPDQVDISVAKRTILRRLNSLSGTVQFVKDMALVLPSREVIHSGDGFLLFSDDMNRANELAAASQGKVVWISDDLGNIYYVRQIRRKEYLKLDHLAVLYLKLDIGGILAEISTRFGLEASLDLSIYHDDRLLYSSFQGVSGGIDALPAFSEGNGRYSFMTIDGNKYFVTDGVLPGSHWRYVHYLDYQSLSKRISSIVLNSVSILLLAMLLSLIIIHYIVKHIIHHLHVLEHKMERFESGDMDMSKFPSYKKRPDEIGMVHQHFDRMVERFDGLIKDNYVKQLLIKDNTIRMLSSQINPHFLYNVLDSIYWLAQGYGADDIEQMSYSLANLFRISISNDEVCVPLKRELEFLDYYIKIQMIRFNDRLSFGMDIPDELLDVFVPKFSIQPLVENAIKHSLELNDEPCRIFLSVRRDGDGVMVSIANTGSCFEEDLAQRVRSRQVKQSGSIGLVNIDERLRLLFGNEYGLSFHNDGGMAIVSFSVPRSVKRNVESTDCR